MTDPDWITESLASIDFAITRLTSDVEHLTGREAIELAREVTLRIRRLNGLCGSLRRRAA